MNGESFFIEADKNITSIDVLIDTSLFEGNTSPEPTIMFLQSFLYLNVVIKDEEDRATSVYGIRDNFNSDCDEDKGGLIQIDDYHEVYDPS